MPTEGMLISDKYGPFITHDIEATDRGSVSSPRRAQGFIDSMALG